jgi:hypothetical protein
MGYRWLGCFPFDPASAPLPWEPPSELLTAEFSWALSSRIIGCTAIA